MRRYLPFRGAAFAAILLASGLAGCGGSRSAESGSGIVAEFRVPGGPKQEVNRIIAGSREASAEEREAASRALEESLDARADGDWAGQCKTLAKKLVEIAEENGSPFPGAHTNCAKNLEKAAEEAPPAVLANRMNGPIAALRLVGSRQAFAFFHGVGGKDYLIPMEEEDGEWVVDSLAPEEIPDS